MIYDIFIYIYIYIYIYICYIYMYIYIYRYNIMYRCVETEGLRGVEMKIFYEMKKIINR